MAESASEEIALPSGRVSGVLDDMPFSKNENDFWSDDPNRSIINDEAFVWTLNAIDRLQVQYRPVAKTS